MLSLIPNWATNYGEFWKAISQRNLWFIRLRYFAVISLIGFLIIGQFFLEFQLSHQQIIAISVIAIIILSYNIILFKVRKFVSWKPDRFNSLHLSLIQMILDLITLMLLVYYTGLIESPLYVFFIFHMIIGSLILPGYLIYIIAGCIGLIFSVLTIFQNYGIVTTYLINGLYEGNISHTFTYDVLRLMTFTIMLFVSVYLANKIANQLYKREQQLRSTLMQLDEAEKTKQKYIIGIIHEIKTPVSAAKSIIDLLLFNYVGPLSEEIHNKLNRVKIRIEETLQLLNNILRISRLKLMDIRTTEEIDITKLIQTIIDKMYDYCKSKNANIIFEDRRTQKKIIKSDIILLELALSNIISNSIKYVDTNGNIEIILKDKEHNFIIEVCDNGIGIPKEDLPKIFNQFYRASNIDKSKHEGSGMGLALVKEIIERLGGRIKVESPSRLSKENFPGTCFEIYLQYDFKPQGYDIFEVNPDNCLSNENNTQGNI